MRRGNMCLLNLTENVKRPINCTLVCFIKRLHLLTEYFSVMPLSLSVHYENAVSATVLGCVGGTGLVS